MLDPLMTLLAAKAKTVGLVAGTALVTSAVVGGGAIGVTNVSAETATVEASPAPSAAAADVVATPLPTEPAATSDTPTATTAPKPAKTPVTPVTFTCDATKNHGQNVSAYGKTVAKGPGRGRQISAAAKSDCGKKAKAPESAETAEAEVAEAPEPPKAAKPAKPAKPGKPAGKGKPAEKGKPKR